MLKTKPGLLHLLRKCCRDTDPASDALLLDRFLHFQDEAAFELLMWRHGSMVLKVCRDILQDSFDAEDAFQATFLVMARKAGSIGKSQSLASWLYKVAYRIAQKARAKRSKRQAWEKSGFSQLPDPVAEKPVDEVAFGELLPVIYEEIARLPAIYQAPLVLCAIEGKTHAQAAQQLGCPKGTVAGRLSRARGMLQRRLCRRGFPLPVGLILAGLMGNHALAAVPPVLAQATCEASFLFAAGKAAGVSSGVLFLAKGVTQAMLISKIKLFGGLILVLAGFVAMGGYIFQGLRGENPPAFQEEGSPKAPAPADEKPLPPRTLNPDKNQKVIRLVSQRDGVILAVGTEIKPGEKVPAERIITVGSGKAGRKFKKIQEGDHVESGQALVLLDDRLALNHLAIARAKVKAAEADYEAATYTYKEAKTRYDSALIIYNRYKGISAEDLRERAFAKDKYLKEVDSKRETAKVAGLAVEGAEIILDMHLVRAPVPGVIRRIYKSPGEGVKALEPVMEIIPDKK